MFAYPSESGSCGEKESGQTVIADDLSALAPLNVEILNLWRDFKKVVKFIDANSCWLRLLMSVCEKRR